MSVSGASKGAQGTAPPRLNFLYFRAVFGKFNKIVSQRLEVGAPDENPGSTTVCAASVFVYKVLRLKQYQLCFTV